ncbi:hypothetical protein ACQPZJ_17010 [Actinoplanes sp. CA-054009]
MTLMAALLGAVIAGGATAWASWQATSSNQKVQHEEFRESRLDEQRARRTEVYQFYLRSADEIRRHTRTIFLCAGAFPMKGPLIEKDMLARLPKCGKRSAAVFRTSVEKLARATDGMYIYGSKDARGYARSFDRNTGLISGWMQGLLPFDYVIKQYGLVSLMSGLERSGAAIQKLRETMCKELNPVDVREC